MTATPPRRGSLSPSAIIGSPMPEGLRLPDVIITRRTRTVSMSCRIEDEVREGTVKFFCRSRGHGFINDDEAAPNDLPIFMHVSDIEGEYIPRKNDRVRYRACPMPPRYDRAQAVHIEIINFTPEVHHKWSEKETPEELLEEKEMIQEEARINEMIVKHRKSSGSIHSMEGGTP